MENDNIPTVGEWYDTLSPRKQILFNISCRVIGDYGALFVFGYRRVQRAAAKAREQAENN